MSKIDTLINNLQSVDETVRENAVAELEEVGQPPVDSVNDLANLLAHQNADVGYWAATLIGRLGQSAAPATVSLALALEHDGPSNVRQRVAWALGKIGPSAETALPALRTAATSTDARLARLATQAIEEIQPH